MELVGKNERIVLRIMKTKIIQIIVATVLFMQAVANQIPSNIDSDVKTLLKKLYNVSQKVEYNSDQFIVDLKNIPISEAKMKDIRAIPNIDPLLIEMLEMSLAVRRPEIIKMIGITKGWYGCYNHNLPDDFFIEKWKIMLDRFGGNAEELRRNIVEDLKNSRIPGEVERLKKEHSTVEYLPVWKFWLMSPVYSEKLFLRSHITQAMHMIGNPSVVPLLMENMKIEVHVVDETKKESALICAATDVSLFPGEAEKALDALLEINRYAITNNLNNKHYYSSVTRNIIRLLASRELGADQRIDPEMKEMFEKRGDTRTFEDFPLRDESWRTYKPLIAARLAAKKDDTPKADIELMEEAMKIMPKK